MSEIIFNNDLTVPNREKIKRESEGIPNDDPRTRKANGLITEAGKILMPTDQGLMLLGSAVLHFYVNASSLSGDLHKYACITQKILDNVPEGLCNDGFVNFKHDLMKAYGRKPPRMVK